MKQKVKKDTITWQCPGCEHKHLWRWDHGDASPGDIMMICDACGSSMVTELVQIGRRAWAAIWPGF